MNIIYFIIFTFVGNLPVPMSNVDPVKIGSSQLLPSDQDLPSLSESAMKCPNPGYQDLSESSRKCPNPVYQDI